MEARMVRLESEVAHLRANVTEIRADVRRLRDCAIAQPHQEIAPMSRERAARRKSSLLRLDAVDRAWVFAHLVIMAILLCAMWIGFGWI